MVKTPEFKVGDRVRVNNECRFADIRGLAVDVVELIHRGGDDLLRIRTDNGKRFNVYQTSVDKLEDKVEWTNPEKVLEEYKKKVLEVALRAKAYVDENNGWCDSGFRETLEELGLSIVPEDNFPNGTVILSKVFPTRMLIKDSRGRWVHFDADTRLSSSTFDTLVGAYNFYFVQFDRESRIVEPE